MKELPEWKHYRTEIYTLYLGIAGDVICATQDSCSDKGITSDISLLSNTVCACAIFTVKLWNREQKQTKKKFARLGPYPYWMCTISIT